MRIVTVALGSFVVGALCMFFWGNHTSTLSHSVFAQQAIANPGAVPVVPPLTHNTFTAPTINGGIVDLDGLESTGGTYSGVTFRYGGGAYKLEGATLVAPIQFSFVGAAANTFSFLASVGMLGCPTQPTKPSVKPNQPMVDTASFKAPVKGDLESPYGQ